MDKSSYVPEILSGPVQRPIKNTRPIKAKPKDVFFALTKAPCEYKLETKIQTLPEDKQACGIIGPSHKKLKLS